MRDSLRGFNQAEFERRTRKAQELMAKSGMAAMWFTTEPEIRYFTGFLTQFWQSPTRPWFVVIPASGKPIAVIPEIGAPLMTQTWIDEVRTWPSPRPDDDGVQLLIDTLKEVAGKTGDIGMPKGSESILRMPLADFEKLQTSLSNRFVDASPIVRQLRMKKSPAEIAKIRHACELADRAFDTIPHLIREATPLDLAFRKFRGACMNVGLDDVPYLAGGAGPFGYKDVISPPTNKRLASGDILMLDTGAVFDGYFCDFNRNFAIHKAETIAIDAYSRLIEATHTGLAAIRPGMRCSALFEAMNNVLGGGENNVGRLGHGLGMQLTEWPSIAAFDETILEPAMVITLEPAIATKDGYMLVTEENIVITESGFELLSKPASQELLVIR